MVKTHIFPGIGLVAIRAISGRILSRKLAAMNILMTRMARFFLLLEFKRCHIKFLPFRVACPTEYVSMAALQGEFCRCVIEAYFPPAVNDMAALTSRDRY